MQFRCELCNKSFVSGYSLAEHFRSKEHKVVSGEERIDSLLRTFIDSVLDTGKPEGKE